MVKKSFDSFNSVKENIIQTNEIKWNHPTCREPTIKHMNFFPRVEMLSGISYFRLQMLHNAEEINIENTSDYENPVSASTVHSPEGNRIVLCSSV